MIPLYIRDTNKKKISIVSENYFIIIFTEK